MLQYSTAKQRLLRESYYEYVVSKSRIAAANTLQVWLSKSIRKICTRDNLQSRIVMFKKKLFFMKMKGIRERKTRSLEIIRYL